MGLLLSTTESPFGLEHTLLRITIALAINRRFCPTMLQSGYEVEKVVACAPSQSENARYLSAKGIHDAQEPSGVACGLWKRDEKWAQKLAHLSRGP
jgi:hypothetical protein